MRSPERSCLIVQPARGLRGSARVPGDKSISHRAVMLASLARGESEVRGWLTAGDTEATLRSVQALGVPVERPAPDLLRIHGRAPCGRPKGPLDFANAGTGIRLMAGIMAGQPFASVLDGSAQLRRRPMQRIIEPLRRMGAQISGEGGRAPLSIKPAALHGIHFDMPVASAQVKSAVLFAGLFARGETVVTEPAPTRDHSECMLRAAESTCATRGPSLRCGRRQGCDRLFPRAGRLLLGCLFAGCGCDRAGQRCKCHRRQPQPDASRVAGRPAQDGGGHTGQRRRAGSRRGGRPPCGPDTAPCAAWKSAARSWCA